MQPAPFFEPIAKGPQGGKAFWLKTSDGLRIRVGHWTAENLKGTVLLFPGRTEYVEKYGPAAQDFLQRGYATAAIDWRGQGLADRTGREPRLGDVVAFADYQRDVQAMVAHVRDLGLPRPYYLVAHSMGGAIGLRALHDGLAVKAAMFSAPMWGITMAPMLRPFAWGLSGISRKAGFHQQFAPGQQAETYVNRISFEENTLTSDREMFDFMQAQLAAEPELALGGPSLRWLNESLREMRKLSRRASPRFACLTFLGDDEAIVDPGRIKARMALWPAGELVTLPKARHEVMMETPAVRATVFNKTAAHFAKHP